jgi:hypothetical protein
MNVWYIECSERISNLGNVDNTVCNLLSLCYNWTKIVELYIKFYVYVHISQVWFVNHLLTLFQMKVVGTS